MSWRSGTSIRVAALAAAAAFAALPAARAEAPPAPGAAATPAPTPLLQPKRNIGGPGDYGLREKIMHAISRDPDLSRERFTLVLVNGGAVFSGEIRSCALEKKALTLAAEARGIINVTDEMTVPRGRAPDAELAKAVTSILSDAAGDLELKNLDVKVADGVLTLEGTVKGVPMRSRAEDLAGTVLGITRISNHLRPADAPSGTDDTTIRNAVINYLGDFRAFSQPSELSVKVEKAVVTLTGRAAFFMGRQQAALVASLVGGVVRVDNRIKVDPSVAPRLRRVQAGT